MLYLLYKQQWNIKPFHFRLESRELLFSHSNSDLFTCEDILFLRESSPGTSLVFIYIVTNYTEAKYVLENIQEKI